MRISTCRVILLGLMVAIALGVAACGDRDRSEAQSDEQRRPVGQNNVFGDTIATKDKARDEVNKAMEQRQEQLEQAMRKQEQAADSEAQ